MTEPTSFEERFVTGLTQLVEREDRAALAALRTSARHYARVTSRGSAHRLPPTPNERSAVARARLLAAGRTVRPSPTGARDSPTRPVPPEPRGLAASSSRAWSQSPRKALNAA